MTEHKIIEGLATITFPSSNEVFYNPVQQFNRDLSIAAIRTWAGLVESEGLLKRKGLDDVVSHEPKIKILEALSATGLRSIRYAKEMSELVDFVVANDMDLNAVESIRLNVAANDLSETKVVPNCSDAWYIY